MAFPLLFAAAGGGPVANGLVLLDLFDEGAGQTINDTSGNAFDGTLGLDASVAADDPSWASGALEFDGSDDLVNHGVDTALRPPAFTICAAAKMPAAQSAVIPLVGWHNTSEDRAVFLAGAFNNNRPFLWMASNKFRYWSKTSPTDVTDGAWHFFCYTLPGAAAADISAAILLVDGIPQDVNSTTAVGVSGATDNFRLGAAGNANFGAFSLAYLSLHNRVLSEPEQSQMQTHAKTVVGLRGITLP